MRGNRWKSLLAVWLALAIPAGARSAYIQNMQQNTQPSDQTQPSTAGQQSPKKDKKKGKDTTGGTNDSSTAPSNTTNAAPAASGSGEPKPLFGGTLNLKSSRQSKDSATLGFNGLDPNGQVQKSFLASAATSADTAKVQQMAQTSVGADELAQFLRDGNLNQQAPAHAGQNK